MKVSFDKSIKVGGIGLVPWTRLGPEKWLDDYKIASLYGWDLGSSINNPKVVALSDNEHEIPNLKRQNTQSLLESPQFQKLLTDNFSGYTMMTYKPVNVPKVLQDSVVKFLPTNRQLAAQLENKAEFRKFFTPLGVPFPNYTIATAYELGNDFMSGKTKAVVQDSVLSGGKGTRIVTSQAEFDAAVSGFATDAQLVLSDFVEAGRERTVQCCVTNFGVLVGPLQKQIVADPLLSNLNTPSADKFCGAEVSNDDELAGVYPEIKSLAIKIGEQMQSMGYKGIFGLDCMIDGDGKVYVLEVNPRITGVTPLLTMLYRQDQDIPFYLLHLLELGGFDYKIEDFELSPTASEGSLMVLHSQSQDTVKIDSSPKSGLYRMPEANLIKGAISFDQDSGNDNWLIQQYTPPGFKVKPGGRLITVLIKDRVLGANDRLLDTTANGVKHLLEQIKITSTD